MTAFPEWHKHLVTQKHEETGCIPWGYEILLRAADVDGIDYDSFQDEFDFDHRHKIAMNNFDFIASAVQRRYPHVSFVIEKYRKGEGEKKLIRVEELAMLRKPVLASIAKKPLDGKPGWHIMPIVELDDSNLTLLVMVESNGQPHTRTISKKDLVCWHNRYQGGDDIAYLKEP